MAAAHCRAVPCWRGRDLRSGPHDLLPDVLVVTALGFSIVECAGSQRCLRWHMLSSNRWHVHNGAGLNRGDAQWLRWLLDR